MNSYLVYYLLFLLLEIILLKIRNWKIILYNVTRTDYQFLKIDIYKIFFLLMIFIFYGWRNIHFGSDFEGYVEQYKEITSAPFLLDKYFKYYEILSYNLVSVFTKLQIPYQVYYGFLSMISYYFIIKSMKKYSYLLPLFLFFIFTDHYFAFSHSAVRQSVAIAIFAYAVKFIEERNFFKYLFWIIIGTMFHLSMIVLLPFYLLKRVKFNRNIAYFIFLFSLTGVLGNLIYNLFIWLINTLTHYFSLLYVYSHYLETNRILFSKSHYGIGIFLRDISILWIFYMSKKVLNYQPNFHIYYVFGFIGIILWKLFYNVEIIIRFNMYFDIFVAFMLAASVYYSTTKFEKRISLLIIIIYIIMFIASFITLYNYTKN